MRDRNLRAPPWPPASALAASAAHPSLASWPDRAAAMKLSFLFDLPSRPVAFAGLGSTRVPRF